MKVENNKNTKTNKKSLLTERDKRNAAFAIGAVNTCDVWRDKEFKLPQPLSDQRSCQLFFTSELSLDLDPIELTE